MACASSPATSRLAASQQLKQRPLGGVEVLTFVGQHVAVGVLQDAQAAIVGAEQTERQRQHGDEIDGPVLEEALLVGVR